jgi:hypothetical protein
VPQGSIALPTQTSPSLRSMNEDPGEWFSHDPKTTAAHVLCLQPGSEGLKFIAFICNLQHESRAMISDGCRKRPVCERVHVDSSPQPVHRLVHPLPSRRIPRFVACLRGASPAICTGGTILRSPAILPLMVDAYCRFKLKRRSNALQKVRPRIRQHIPRLFNTMSRSLRHWVLLVRSSSRSPMTLTMQVIHPQLMPPRG